MRFSSTTTNVSALSGARWRRRLAVFALAGTSLGAAGLAGGPPAHASGFTVTSQTDGAPGSLRDAIDKANAQKGPDVISIPAGTFTISIPGRGEDGNATGDLDILDEVTIVGSAGAAVTIIDGNHIDRVFDVQAGSLTIQGVTVTNGDSRDPNTGFGPGGAIQTFKPPVTVLDSVLTNNDGWYGGAMAVRDTTVSIQRTELSGNRAHSVPGNGASGGAMSLTNTAFTVSDSTFTTNHAFGGNGGASMFENSSGTITNSTFDANIADNVGGALQSSNDSSVLLRHATIAANVANGGQHAGGGLFVQQEATVSLQNTLLWKNVGVNATADNCENNGAPYAGTFVSTGGNLSSDAACTFLTSMSDHDNDSNTTLGALGANGGPTRTRALGAGSSAIDGAPCMGIQHDQRAFGRPAGASCDVGAYEAAAVVPPTTSTTAPATTSTTAAPTTTSTTAAPTTTSTTAPPTTTTAPPAAPTSTTVASSSSVPPAKSAPTAAVLNNAVERTTTAATGTLPVTGAPVLRLALAAFGLVLLGGLLLAEARRRSAGA